MLDDILIFSVPILDYSKTQKLTSWGRKAARQGANLIINLNICHLNKIIEFYFSFLVFTWFILNIDRYNVIFF